LTVMMSVPVFLEKHRSWDVETRKSRMIEAPNLAQTGRIMFNALKAKLTSIAGGLVKFEDEFLADIAIPTPQGPKRYAEVRGRSELLSLPEVEA